MTGKLLGSLVFSVALAASVSAFARGGGGGHSSAGSHGGIQAAHPRASSPSPGTGAKSQSEGVHGYQRKDGTYVAPYHRSTPDKSFTNNWSTKGNTNPSTGKPGTRVEPPTKH